VSTYLERAVLRALPPARAENRAPPADANGEGPDACGVCGAEDALPASEPPRPGVCGVAEQEEGADSPPSFFGGGGGAARFSAAHFSGSALFGIQASYFALYTNSSLSSSWVLFFSNARVTEPRALPNCARVGGPRAKRQGCTGFEDKRRDGHCAPWSRGRQGVCCQKLEEREPPAPSTWGPALMLPQAPSPLVVVRAFRPSLVLAARVQVLDLRGVLPPRRACSYTSLALPSVAGSAVSRAGQAQHSFLRHSCAPGMDRLLAVASAQQLAAGAQQLAAGAQQRRELIRRPSRAAARG
jgi:hypothetical protein